MPDFDIVFEKLHEQMLQDGSTLRVVETMPSPNELDEIDELRRLSAEIQEPDPSSFTTT